MLVSQLITALQKMQDTFGDLPVGSDDEGFIDEIKEVTLKQAHALDVETDDYTGPRLPVINLVRDPWVSLGEIEKTVTEEHALIADYAKWAERKANPACTDKAKIIEAFIEDGFDDHQRLNEWSDAAVRRVLTEWLNTPA